MNTRPKLRTRNRELMIACVIVGPVMLLGRGTSVSAQTIRFFPIRSAPLGSPVGTVGDPVTPIFNDALQCWEVKVSGSVEVDLDLQAFGWGDAAGSPNLGAIQAAVLSAGYDNGVGAPLNPKGWPGSPGDGIYQATRWCGGGGDLSPCVDPFDSTCDGHNNGFCIDSPNWVMPPCTEDLQAIATPTLDYAWATAARNDCNVDDGEVKTMGGLILEVPSDAAGTYVIAVDPDPNNTFFSGGGTPPCCVVKTAACITITTGACCIDTDSDELLDTCQDDTLDFECVAGGGLYLGGGSTCSGVIGACCLDGDEDGRNDTCVVMDRDCCLAGKGRFSGPGFQCLGDQNNSGVDDLCDGAIPAVSEWGLIVLTLLLLAGIKISFARRQSTASLCSTGG